MARIGRPSFSVVTWVVVCLSFVGLAARLLESQIPPVPANRLATERSEFLRQAAFQRIDWLPMGKENLARARASALPVMIVIGSPGSRFGRDLDRYGFADNRVADFLRRNFASVRVDVLERPEWRNVYLPVSRAERGLVGDTMIAFLRPDGQVFDLLFRLAPGESLDAQAFLGILVSARDAYERSLAGEPEGGAAQAQAGDLAAIKAGGAPLLPDLTAYAEQLRAATSKGDGLASGGYVAPRPMVWSFLSLTGQTAALEDALAPIVSGSLVDWLDGGLFSLSSSDWRRVELDKSAVVQAASALALARELSVRDDPVIWAIADGTIRSLMEGFAKEGFIRAIRIGDEGKLSRSPRSSFSPRRLRELVREGSISEEERALAVSAFGLDVRSNPQMLIRGADPARVVSGAGQALLGKLANVSEATPPTYTSGVFLDVNGYVAARLIETAQMLGNDKLLRDAISLADRLDVFLSADEVIHSLTGAPDYAYIGDYLSLADAKLQVFLATGSVPALEQGARIMARMTELFFGRDGGGYRMVAGASAEAAPPEILDNAAESTSAQLIRLLNGYGRVLGQRGLDMRRRAYALAGRYGALAARGGASAAGYFGAVLDLINESYAVTVGSDAVEQARALRRKMPGRLVAPAVGPVRKDLQEKARGIYAVSGSATTGPYSPDEIVAILGRSLSLSPRN